MTADDFAEQVGPRFVEPGSFTREIGRTTEMFGNITHVVERVRLEAQRR